MGKWALRTALLAAACIEAGGAGQLSTPRPQDAVAFLVSASQRYPVIELSHVEGSGNGNEMDMIAHLFADPRFTGNIDDVVIEGCNSRYQSIVDRYVAGEEVSPQQIADVCRKTTQIMGGEADRTMPMLVDVVRAYNLKAPQHRLRALAADPPIDWRAIHTSAQFDVFLAERDSYAVAIVETQVLAKHRRALVVFGGGHLTRWADPRYGDTITMRLERRYPDVTYVIYSITDFSRFNASARRTFYSWSAPVIVPIAGTQLALESGRTITSADTMRRVGSHFVPVDNAYPGHTLGQLFDAILYLGPPNKLRTIELKEPTDEPYASELKRIRAIVMGTPSPT